MTLDSAQRTLIEIIVGVVLFLVVGVVIIKYERDQGALAAQLHAVDSTRVIAVQDAARALTLADQAAARASAAQTIALQQIAAGRALQAHTDSAAHVASEERDHARHLLADSLATVFQLRASLSRVLATAYADSTASARLHDADHGIIRSLEAVLMADSVQHAADQRALSASQAVTASLQRELGIVKAEQPSKVIGVLKVVGWSAGAFALGRLMK